MATFNAATLAEAIALAISTKYEAVTTGVVEFDAETVSAPAVLIIPLGFVDFDGSLDNDDQASCRMQITCIGQTTLQCGATQMAVYRLLMSQVGSSYTAPLLAEGQPPLWRKADQLGPVIPGDRVYRTNDMYTFKETLL